MLLFQSFWNKSSSKVKSFLLHGSDHKVKLHSTLLSILNELASQYPMSEGRFL